MTSPPPGLLLGDVGGTHARFLLLEGALPLLPPAADALRLDLRCASAAAFDDIVATALGRLGRADGRGLDAVFGIAGPVRDGRAWFTNLPWAVDAAAVVERFGFASVELANDLAVAARALALHPPDDAVELQPGIPAPDARHAVISVGTGLGVAYWSGPAPLRIDAAEAGHAGFAPEDAAQRALHAALARELDGGRVSWERVLSGAGLARLDAERRGGAPQTAPEVARRALDGDADARAAIDDFARLLGAFAGDLALAAPATGGIWLIGGVVGGLGAAFPARRFLEGFRDKGRLSPLLQEVAVRRSADGALGLRGALALALSPQRRAASASS